jgi:hypothetical protein
VLEDSENVQNVVINSIRLAVCVCRGIGLV